MQLAMKSGKAYILLVISGVFLIVLYIALSDVKPTEQKRNRIRARYNNMRLEEIVTYQQAGVTDMVGSNKTDSMKQRIQTQRQSCQELKAKGLDFGHIKKSNLDHIIVNDEYKLLYCYVPKVACTNLKRIFLLLTGKMNQTEPLQLKSGDVHEKYDKYLKYLDTLSVDGIRYRLQFYRKILFVREPLERVLSAFRNKFTQKGNTYFKERFGRKIIKYFRQNPSESALETGDDVKFSEFVQYLLLPQTREYGYNEHWAGFTDLCHPCHIHYDFIGKYESLDEDVDHLLEDIGVSDFIKFPERGDTYRTKKTEDILQQYYQEVKPEFLKDLMDVYINDYKVFGYKFPESVMQLMNDN